MVDDEKKRRAAVADAASASTASASTAAPTADEITAATQHMET